MVTLITSACMTQIADLMVARKKVCITFLIESSTTGRQMALATTMQSRFAGLIVVISKHFCLAKLKLVETG